MLDEDNTEITVGEFVAMVWGVRVGAGTECEVDTGWETGTKCELNIECGGAALSEGSGASLTLCELLRYGHFRGWLEDCDERHPETLLNRQTAARIIHQFMVVELGVPDIADIKEAEKLRDLYTCRVCANHIAQVYLRGIMGAREIDGVDSSVSVGTGAAQSVLIFNHLGRVTQSEAREAMEGLRSKQPQRVSELCERTIEDAERE